MTPSVTLENSSRLQLIDALRGFALLGIILANIPYPNEISSIYRESRLMVGSAQTDQFLRTAVSFFIDKKFITIFSILFGFGFSVQVQKMRSTSVAFKSYFVRRMLLLFVIGCIHAYILWFGDIIRDYAICGLLLLLVYHWPLKRILWTAIIFAGPLTAIVFILNEALVVYKH
ncbi:hypothetical protein GXP67_09135 [Rhodocytophaga rosea]|uniref:DUF418 domain-containing protein n=1 Tax=Rhodocytophaga rosea TaxID=2704465 RepID=A0A6C0GFX4_9BACT|nr:hypothetical protein [Rhodocytophaga rosea]QHT66809.1 hypothetical protein GXP67_09135 [Rhodocytophaga rosea]